MVLCSLSTTPGYLFFFTSKGCNSRPPASGPVASPLQQHSREPLQLEAQAQGAGYVKGEVMLCQPLNSFHLEGAIILVSEMGQCQSLREI